MSKELYLLIGSILIYSWAFCPFAFFLSASGVGDTSEDGRARGNQNSVWTVTFRGLLTSAFVGWFFTAEKWLICWLVSPCVLSCLGELSPLFGTNTALFKPHNYPKIIITSVKHKLALAMGACHLPLQGLNHVLLQWLTFDTPLKGFRVERRKKHSVLWEHWQDRSSDFISPILVSPHV